MNEGPSPQPDKRKAKAIGYFVAAGVLLVALGFVWSIDQSFGYISLGAIAFLAFMGFWNWPRQSPNDRYQREYTQSTQRESRAEQYAPRASKGEPTPSNAAPDHQTKKKAVVIAISVFSFSIFLFIILGVFLRSNDEGAPSYYFSVAEQYYGQNMFDSAYLYYKRALREDPNQPDALLGLGNTFHQLNNPDSAIILYDQALAANPDLDAARYFKGWVEYDRKHYADAERELIALVNKNPSHIEAMQLLGNVFYDQNRYEEALSWYQRAYDNGFRGSWICQVMGFLYQNKGDNTRAIALYKESLTYDSTVLDVYQRLGKIVPGEEGEYYRQRGEGRQW